MRERIEKKNKKQGKKIQKNFPVVLILLVALISSSFLSYSPRTVLGAAYYWIQIDWSGGATTTAAVHPGDQSGWSYYFSKDFEIATGTDLTLAATSFSFIQTSDTDFNAGTMANTMVSGSGEAAEVNLSLSPFSTTTAGGYHTLALKTDGTLWAWGDNWSGQLGLGFFLRAENPEMVISYYSSGTFISSAIDTGQSSNFTTLTFTISEPTNTDLKFQLRTASTSADLSPATWYGPTGTDDYYTTTDTAINSVHDGHRWIQYKAYFLTTDTSVTPTLSDITINYTYYPASGILTSSAYDTTDSNNLFDQIEWNETLPSAPTTVKFQLRTSPDGSTWTDWWGATVTGPDYFTNSASGCSKSGTKVTCNISSNIDIGDGLDDRWIQYRVFLETTDSTKTPTLSDVTLGYGPAKQPPSVSFPPPVSTTGYGKVFENLGGEIRRTFESGNLAKVVFPPYSIKGMVVVKIEPQDKNEVIKNNPLPKNTQIVSDLVANFQAFSRGKELEKFEKVVPITFTYTDKQIKEAGVDEKTLKIYWWDKFSKIWKPLKSKVNTLTNTVTAYTIHFTLFAVMGEIKEKPITEMTVAELQAEIARITALIAQIRVQLAELLAALLVIEGIPAGFTFENNLKFGMISDQVRYLQIILNSDPETQLAKRGVGSPGNETNYFGPLTKAAVIKFQEKYASDILAPWGLTKGTGFVGKTTRAKINEILGR